MVLLGIAGKNGVSMHCLRPLTLNSQRRKGIVIVTAMATQTHMSKLRVHQMAHQSRIKTAASQSTSLTTTEALGRKTTKSSSAGECSARDPHSTVFQGFLHGSEIPGPAGCAFQS